MDVKSLLQLDESKGLFEYFSEHEIKTLVVMLFIALNRYVLRDCGSLQ